MSSSVFRGRGVVRNFHVEEIFLLLMNIFIAKIHILYQSDTLSSATPAKESEVIANKISKKEREYSSI